MAKKLNSNAATVRNSAKVQIMRDSLRNFDSDHDRENRLVQLQCKTCWYIREYAPQVFSVYRCQSCGIPKINHDGPVPCLCEGCAIDLKLCKQCSAEMDE